MALADQARAIIVSTSGPIKAAEEDDIEDALSRLGSARAVSLERLQARYTLMMISPADVSSDSDRVNHSQNLKHLAAAVLGLARAARREPDLNAEAQALVEAALADTPQAQGTASITVIASNRRPG